MPNWGSVFQDPTLPLMVDIGSGMPQIYIFPAHWYVHPLVINWMFSGSHLVKVFYLVIAMLDLFNSAIDHNVQYICRQWSISPVACKNKAWFKKLFGPGNTKEGTEMNILINFFSNAVWKLLEITLFYVCVYPHAAGQTCRVLGERLGTQKHVGTLHLLQPWMIKTSTYSLRI